MANIYDASEEKVSDKYNILSDNIFPSGLYIVSTFCLALAMIYLSLFLFAPIYLFFISIPCAFTYLVITCIGISKEWKYFITKNSAVRISYVAEFPAMVLSVIILLLGFAYFVEWYSL